MVAYSLILWVLFIVSVAIHAFAVYGKGISKKPVSDIAVVIAATAVSVAFGIVYALSDTSLWDYTKTVQWAVQGTKTYGPTSNLVFGVLGGALVFALVSHIIARLIVWIIKAVKSRGKQSKHPMFMRECIYCHEFKEPYSARSDFGGKICGERICNTCLDALGFKTLLSIDERLEAYSGKGRFNSADDVIRELKRRREI